MTINIDYKFLQNSSDPWFCISFCSEIFNAVKNKNFISNFYDSNSKSKKTDGKGSSLLQKPTEHLKYLANHFDNMSSPPDDINSDEAEILFHINTMILRKLTN